MTDLDVVGLPGVRGACAEAEGTISGGRCRVCLSPFLAYVRHIPMRRMRLANPIFFCMECESFQLPHVYVETDEQLRRDAEWHVSVEERNRRWAHLFFDAALQRDPTIGSVLEIGCGTGTLLDVGRSRGLRVRGHDTNPYVGAIAKQRHDLDLECTIWAGDMADAFDLVVCISTVEHLPEPRRLIAELAAYGHRTGAHTFISVPFLTERDKWSHLLEPVPSAPTNPLHLSDVHINHFSHRGFTTMLSDFGAVALDFCRGGWLGYWVRF